MRPDAVTPDVLVIGAGPAGISTALWCARLNRTVRIFDHAAQAGGQLQNIPATITDYPGLGSIDPRALAERLVTHLHAQGIQIERETRVQSIDIEQQVVDLESGQAVGWQRLVLATGARKRTLGVPGEDNLRGLGVRFHGPKTDEHFDAQQIVVVGGGDTACENTLVLAKMGHRVTVLVRGSRLRGRKFFADPIQDHPNIDIRYDASVVQFTGSETLEGVVFNRSGTTEQIETSLCFVHVGTEPSSELVRGIVRLEDSGHVAVDRSGKTSHPLLWAVGDVAAPHAPSVAWAVGSAMAASKDIELSLSVSRRR